jgi:hypothetical protein
MFNAYADERIISRRLEENGTGHKTGPSSRPPQI